MFSPPHILATCSVGKITPRYIFHSVQRSAPANSTLSERIYFRSIRPPRVAKNIDDIAIFHYLRNIQNSKPFFPAQIYRRNLTLNWQHHLCYLSRWFAPIPRVIFRYFLLHSNNSSSSPVQLPNAFSFAKFLTFLRGKKKVYIQVYDEISKQ